MVHKKMIDVQEMVQFDKSMLLIQNKDIFKTTMSLILNTEAKILG